MKSQRTQLVKKIAMMEKILRCQQIKLNTHKEYLADVVNNNWIVIVSALLPAFLWGWKNAREKGIARMIRPIIKIGFLAVLSRIKKQFIPTYKY